MSKNILDILKQKNLEENLEEKKEQTNYKIKYVTEYVNKWVHISASRKNIKYINFIDSMCNNGIYRDGDYTTGIECLKIFCDYANLYEKKIFNIFLNDSDKNKIEIIKLVVKEIINPNIKNINIYYNEKDVNLYLTNFKIFDTNLKNNAATVLFVDPYNFRTVELESIKEFIKKYYCEVIFNVFTSDFTRNKPNLQILKCIRNTNIKTTDELMEYIAKELKVAKMKFSFSYSFKILTNTELYQIFFITPNSRGLEVLKEALWTVFKGKQFHRNNGNQNLKQISMFDDMRDSGIANIYSTEAQNLVLKNFANQTIHYDSIKILLLERSMLKESQIVNLVIKPLIKENKILKNGFVKNKNNFKEDSYIIKGA